MDNEEADDAEPSDPRAALEERYPGLAGELGVEQDATLGRRFGISRERVRQLRDKLGIAAAGERGWDIAYPLLGALPDTEVARRSGISTKRIASARRAQGIEAVDPAVQRAAIEAHAHELGKAPDYVFARAHGVSTSYVQSVRESLGIPALKPRAKRSRRGRRGAA